MHSENLDVKGILSGSPKSRMLPQSKAPAGIAGSHRKGLLPASAAASAAEWALSP